MVGRAVAGARHWWVLATKLAQPTLEGPNGRGASRRYIFAAAEASLRRLGTDVIDILYLHREDHGTPMAETVRAIGDLMRQGKIRYFGVSNHRSWRIAEICRLCDQEGIDRPVASQPLYNALNRQIETEHLPACCYFGLGVVPYSPLARGVLTGKYPPDAPAPEGTRAGRHDKRMMETEWRPESLPAAQEIAAHARSRGVSPGQFALAWVLNNRLVTAAIAGPRTAGQWDEYVGALSYRVTAEDEAFVDRLVATGHASTPDTTTPPIRSRGASREPAEPDGPRGELRRAAGARPLAVRVAPPHAGRRSIDRRGDIVRPRAVDHRRRRRVDVAGPIDVMPAPFVFAPPLLPPLAPTPAIMVPTRSRGRCGGEHGQSARRRKNDSTCSHSLSPQRADRLRLARDGTQRRWRKPGNFRAACSRGTERHVMFGTTDGEL